MRTDLRLRRLWNQIDPHQKTILSDDFGMGFPALYLAEHFAFEDFADTRFVLDKLLAGVASPAARSHNGAAKLPDFIAIDSLGRLHILECKGTQVHRYLRNALKRGVEQKNNVSNGGIFASTMVSAIYVPQFNSPFSPELIFVDPEPDERLKLLGQRIPVEKIQTEVRRQSLAKSLSAAGVWQAATAVARGSVPTSATGFVRNYADGELRSAGFEKSGDVWVKKVEYRALEPREDAERLVEPTVDMLEPVDSVLTFSLPDSLMRAVSESIRPNGTILEGPLDQWLSDAVHSHRAEAPSQDVRVRRGKRTLTQGAPASAWRTKELDEEATLTTSADIQFRLARRRS